ncbi:hypothetical protein TorRG33x02_247560 [Trema orientale]|uniref:Endonuclease/exonuclease/phosphatase n=1 Tax=Trema orientale TaxID=63057 RepID=A0A2P5DLK5_TREOI|nr:hypothetical protein TorRG33x02_247560 [Trema orientale]
MNARKAKNLISKIERSDGTLLESEDNIVEEVVSFFQNLYKSYHGRFKSFIGVEWSPITSSQADWLIRPFEEEEVKGAVFECDGDKAPGLDGFMIKLFQQCWDTIKSDLLVVFQEFYQNGIINATTPETYICLIPKKLNSCKIGDFCQSVW